jgi:hypothetical protein
MASAKQINIEEVFKDRGEYIIKSRSLTVYLLNCHRELQYNV